MLGICNRINLIPAIDIPRHARAPLKITGIILMIGAGSAAGLLLPNVGYALATAGGGTIVGLVLMALADKRPSPRPIRPPRVPPCTVCTRIIPNTPQIRNIHDTPTLDHLLGFLNIRDILPIAALNRGWHKYVQSKLTSRMSTLERLFDQDRCILSYALRQFPLAPIEPRALMDADSRKTNFFLKITKEMLHILINIVEEEGPSAQRRAEIQQSIDECTTMEESLHTPPQNSAHQFYQNVSQIINKLSSKEQWQITINAARRQDLLMIRLLFKIKSRKPEWIKHLLEKHGHLCTAKDITNVLPFLLQHFPIALRIESHVLIGFHGDLKLIQHAIATDNVSLLSFLLPRIKFEGDKSELKYYLIKEAASKNSIESAKILLKTLPEPLANYHLSHLFDIIRPIKNDSLFNLLLEESHNTAK